MVVSRARGASHSKSALSAAHCSSSHHQRVRLSSSRRVITCSDDNVCFTPYLPLLADGMHVIRLKHGPAGDMHSVTCPLGARVSCVLLNPGPCGHHCCGGSGAPMVCAWRSHTANVSASRGWIAILPSYGARVGRRVCSSGCVVLSA